MADSRATETAYLLHTKRRSQVLALSISLSILLVAPLWLDVLLPDARRGSLESATLANPPYNPAPDITAIKGEVLIRFKAPVSQALETALRQTTSPDGITYLPKSLLIGARLDADIVQEAAPQFKRLFDLYQLSAADAIDPALGMWRLRINDSIDPQQAAQTFAEQTTFVRYAEPDYPIYAFNRDPNDPYYKSSQPALQTIKAPQAWDITTGSSNVTIAILDTGLAYGHTELSDKIITGRGRNFVASPANAFAWDDNGHGTVVAGIAAADTNNNSGIAGVSWGARLISIKVLDEDEQGSIASLAMGLDYASTQPINIVNMSTGGPVRSQMLEDVAQMAYDRGLILVAASGNTGKQEYRYPAAFDTVIAVGASNQLDQIADFSTYGPYVALVAPGDHILSTSWADNPDYVLSSGTSDSCPFVVGALALMLSVNPKLTPGQARNILETTADPINANPAPTLPGTAKPTPTVTPAPVSPPPGLPAYSGVTPGAISASELNNSYNPRTGWGRLDIYQAVLAARNNDTRPARLNTINGTVSGLPDPQEAVVQLNPGDERFPAKDGTYSFSNLLPGSYTLTILSRKYGLQATSQFNFENQDGQQASFNYDFTGQLAAVLASGEPVGAFKVTAEPPDDGSNRYFPASGHSISGPFRNFWEENGGLLAFGYPISEQLQEAGMTVQYFERAVLEYHAEYALTKAQVQPRLLGTLLTASQQKDPAFQPVPAPLIPDTYYFPSTGHSIAAPFRNFWENSGNVALFGYPISEPFSTTDAAGKTHLSQYFERCRMDYFPESKDPTYIIQLGLLGRQSAEDQHLLNAQP